MDIVNIIQQYIEFNDNIKDEREYITQLIYELEFLFDLYDSSDDEMSDVFSDDEISDEEFDEEELQQLNNLTICDNGEFYFN